MQTVRCFLRSSTAGDNFLLVARLRLVPSVVVSTDPTVTWALCHVVCAILDATVKPCNLRIWIAAGWRQ